MLENLIHRRKFIKVSALSGAAIGLMGPLSFARGANKLLERALVYTLSQKGTIESYDESMAVACLQGIINRASPLVYVVSTTNN